MKERHMLPEKRGDKPPVYLCVGEGGRTSKQWLEAARRQRGSLWRSHGRGHCWNGKNRIVAAGATAGNGQGQFLGALDCDVKNCEHSAESIDRIILAFNIDAAVAERSAGKSWPREGVRVS